MPQAPDALSSLEAFLSPAPPPLRLVVIDDQPDAVLMLLTLLRHEGYEAHGFASAVAAMKELTRLQPDVVISDVSMPQMNGWELAREIRQVMGEQPTLIGISGHYTRGPDKALAELSGFNFYLTKPYDPQVLMSLLRPLAPNRFPPMTA